MLTVVVIVVVAVAALEVSRRWPTLGIAVGVGVIGLGVFLLAGPAPRHGGAPLDGFGDAFVGFLGAVIIAIGAIWTFAAGRAVRARRKRRSERR